MDFERNIVKALFFDIQVDEVCKAICDGLDSLYMRKQIVEVMKWTMPSFTYSQLENLSEIEYGKWKGDKSLGCPLCSLTNAARMLVKNNAGNIVVDFNNMLRWHEMAMWIGEDLLSCAAYSTFEEQRTSFDWPEVAVLDSNTLSEVWMDKHTCDLHLHVGSSYDKFSLSWIMMMNDEGKPSDKMVLMAKAIRYALFRGITSSEWDDFSTDIVKYLLNATDADCNDYMNTVNDEIGNLKKGTPKLSIRDGAYWDYAMGGVGDDVLANDSPYLLLYGERKFMYSYLYSYGRNDKKALKLSACFYLYCIIKIMFRKQFILNNGLTGLKNFQIISNHRCEDLQVLDKLFTFRTSCDKESKRHAEVRFTAEDNDRIQGMVEFKITPPLFFNGDVPSLEEGRKVDAATLVLSITKPQISSNAKREKFDRVVSKVFDIFHDRYYAAERGENEIPLVGIDFAGSDMKVRPYVFAQLVRYARYKGFNNFTYHAGEDFHDIIDGLRAIDEVLHFLYWGEGNRIGHALSLFVDIQKYYEDRHWNIVMPKQVMLDNLVWLTDWCRRFSMVLESETRTQIGEKINSLSKDIYNKVWNIDDFIVAYQLRGDNADELTSEGMDRNSYQYAAYDINKLKIWGNGHAAEIHKGYRSDSCITKGSRIDSWQMPKSKKILELLKKIQGTLLGEVISRHIHIETCPTSNLCIGPFARYDELPSAQLYHKIDRASFSINTDIKGAIATNLETEYSLIGLSLIKSGRDMEEVKSYLRKVIDASMTNRFTKHVQEA